MAFIIATNTNMVRNCQTHICLAFLLDTVASDRRGRSILPAASGDEVVGGDAALAKRRAVDSLRVGGDLAGASGIVASAVSGREQLDVTCGAAIDLTGLSLGKTVAPALTSIDGHLKISALASVVLKVELVGIGSRNHNACVRHQQHSQLLHCCL